jgi:hypothetical protein
MTIVTLTRLQIRALMGALVALCVAGVMPAYAADGFTGTGGVGDLAPKCKPGLTITPHDQFGDVNRILVLPPSEELNLGPHTQVQKCIGVNNRTSKKLQIELSTVDIAPSDNGDTVLNVVKSYRFGTSTWIRLSVKSLVLDAGSDALVSYTIVVPNNPAVGSNYGGIEVSGKPVSAGGLGVVPSIVSQVLVTVPGAVVRKGRVVATRSPRVIEHGSFAAFRFEYENRGTVTDHITGSVKIKSALTGKLVATKQYESSRVLRGGRRSFITIWESPPWIGRFQPTLVVKTDEGTQTVQLPAIWVIPPKWFWLILLALITLAFAIRQWSRWRDRKWLETIEAVELDEFHGSDL